MSKGLNVVQVIGNMGADPELRNAGQTPVCEISLGVNESWVDRASGEKKERTEWVRLVFWGKSAEIIAEYTHKGSRIFASGQLQTEKYTDKEGVEKYATKVRVRDFLLLDSKPAGERGGYQQGENRKPAKDCPQPDQGGFDDDSIPF